MWADTQLPVTMSSPTPNGQLEASRTGTNRIDVENPVALLDQRLVRVTRNDNTYARRIWPNVESREVVNCIYDHITCLNNFSFSQGLGPQAPVDIATHRGDWREPGQLLDDAGVANVAAMDDVVAAFEKSYCFRPEKAVSIGDETYSVHGAGIRLDLAS